MNVHVESLRAVLCDPEGKCCISGSDADRAIVDQALAALAQPAPDADGADDKILWGVVANAGRLSTERKPRWAHVVDATGKGSTSAAALCKRFGFDPDESRGGASSEPTPAQAPGDAEHGEEVAKILADRGFHAAAATARRITAALSAQPRDVPRFAIGDRVTWIHGLGAAFTGVIEECWSGPVRYRIKLDGSQGYVIGEERQVASAPQRKEG